MRLRESSTKSGATSRLDDPVPHAPDEANKPQATPKWCTPFCGGKRPLHHKI